MPAASHLRPRTGPELVDAGVQLVREHARPLLLLGVLVVLPGLAINIANVLFLQQDWLAVGQTGLPAWFWLAVIPGSLITVCWLFVAFGALARSAAAAYTDGRALDPAAAVRDAVSRAGTLVGSGLLTYLLIIVQFIGVAIVLGIAYALLFGVLGAATGLARGSVAGAATAGIVGIVLGLVGVLLFLAAGAFLTGRYITLPAVVVIEGLGARAAMARARDLSRGSMKRITLLLLLVGVLFFAVGFGAVAVATFALQSPIAAGVVVTVLNVPLYTLLGALTTVLYYDLRIRHEGLDIELLADELGDVPNGVSPGPVPGAP